MSPPKEEMPKATIKVEEHIVIDIEASLQDTGAANNTVAKCADDQVCNDRLDMHLKQKHGF